MTYTNILNVEQAAVYLGICSETLRKYVKDGLVEHVRGLSKLSFDLKYLAYLRDAPDLYRRKEAMRLLNIRSYDRVQRLVETGTLHVITHTLYGQCFDREEVNRLIPQLGGKLISASAAARLMNVSTSTLRRWRQEGRVKPASTTPTGRHLYRRDDLPRIALKTKAVLLHGPAAQVFLGLRYPAIRAAVSRGELKVVKTPGGRWRYLMKDLEAFKQKLEAKRTE